MWTCLRGGGERVRSAEEDEDAVVVVAAAEDDAETIDEEADADAGRLCAGEGVPTLAAAAAAMAAAIAALADAAAAAEPGAGEGALDLSVLAEDVLGLLRARSCNSWILC